MKVWPASQPFPHCTRPWLGSTIFKERDLYGMGGSTAQKPLLVISRDRLLSATKGMGSSWCRMLSDCDGIRGEHGHIAEVLELIVEAVIFGLGKQAEYPQSVSDMAQPNQQIMNYSTIPQTTCNTTSSTDCTANPSTFSPSMVSRGAPTKTILSW